MAALGEMPIREGKVNIKGRVAYVSQQAWVFSASVRKNITFSESFDTDKYNAVISAAALKKVGFVSYDKEKHNDIIFTIHFCQIVTVGCYLSSLTCTYCPQCYCTYCPHLLVLTVLSVIVLTVLSLLVPKVVSVIVLTVLNVLVLTVLNVLVF